MDVLYELMNKDRVLAILNVTETGAHIDKIIGTIPGYIGDVTSWVDGRTSPIGRANIVTLLKLAGIRNRQEYLLVTYGISLTDTFWVRPVGNTMVWDRVSPYKNRLSRIISEIALNGGFTANNVRSPSPEYTLDGSTDKCWKRENGIIYLYKTNGEKWSGITGNRPYCEYYACQVAKQLISNKRHFVHYSIKVAKTDNGYNKAYVKCPIFTSERFGYLPMDQSGYSGVELIDLYKVLPDDSQLILREMLLLDSIILNFDRHMGNYGFIVNNDTYRLQSFAPIFDNDCSLGGFVSLKSANIKEAYIEALRKQPRTELGGYIKQARMSLTDELISNMKNMYPFHFDRLPRDIDVEDERIKFMEFIVNSQIKAILHG